MLDDFGQFPPVLDFFVYANTSQDLLSNNGLAIYKLFQEVYELDVIQHQSGNSQKQHNFRNLLLWLRNEESTIDDWKILIMQFEGKLSRTEWDSFSDAIFFLMK